MQLYEHIESEQEKQQAGKAFDHQALSTYRQDASADEGQRKHQFQIDREPGDFVDALIQIIDCLPAAIQSNRTAIPNVIGLKARKLLSLRVVINALILGLMPALIAL